jgi:hypothetical protein
VHLKYVLGQIYTDRANFTHGRSSLVAVATTTTLAHRDAVEGRPHHQFYSEWRAKLVPFGIELRTPTILSSN